MTYIKQFDRFINELKKSLIDYSDSRNKILVGLKTNLLRDMKERYDHKEDGDTIYFFDSDGKHFGTLFDMGTRYQELRHNGKLNDKGWLKENLTNKAAVTENFPGPGETVDAKDLDNDMLDYFNRTNKVLSIDTKSKKGIKGSVGKMYNDLVFNGDTINKKDIVRVKILESKESDALASAIDKAMIKIDDEMPYKDFAAAVATILRDEYGTHNYMPFIEELKKNL